MASDAAIDSKIEEVNERLKAANIRVRVRRKNASLYLRATLPVKTGEGVEGDRKRYELAIGVTATPAGLKRAEAEAKKLAAEIDCKEFNWANWHKEENEVKGRIVGDWVEEFEKSYFERRARTPKSELTWKKDYWVVLKKLPSGQAPTTEVLRSLVTSYEADSKSRKRAHFVVKAFAKFVGVDVDLEGLSGNYSIKRATPRELPEDSQIAQWRDGITNPSWQWVYGILATYGLRNHEVFNLDLDSLKQAPGILQVVDGKTGARRVWPCYPEWWERWQLWDVKMPQVSGPNNGELGHRVSTQFRRMGLTSPYNLRHAWAVRSMEYGLDVALSAQQMGHSLTVHQEIYFHWITERHHQRAFDILMNRLDKPKAP